MAVKVFTTNSNGKVEFTKEELEALLNDVFMEGRNTHFAIQYGYPYFVYDAANTPNTTTIIY